MKIRILIVILALIVILNHCKTPDNNKAGNKLTSKRIVDLDENKAAAVSFKFNKRVNVVDVTSPKIAISKGADKIYVYGDSAIRGKKSFIIKMYNNKLEYISQKLFHKGQGPGDVGLTNVVTPTEENIFICENSNLRVSIYENDFKYIKSVKFYRNSTYPFELIENGRFFVGSKLVYPKNRLDAYSFNIVSFPKIRAKELYQTEPYYPRDEKRRFLLGEYTEFFYFYKNKDIYLLLMKKYQILKYDLSGKKIDDLTLKVRDIVTPKDKEKQFLEEQGFRNRSNSFGFSKTVTPTSVIVPLNKGFIVIRREDYSTECNGLVDGDYFSYQLTFVGKVKVPCFFDIYKITGGMPTISNKYDNNYLYLVNEVEEDCFLEKWEVKE